VAYRWTELDDILSLDEAARMLERSPITLRWAAQTGRLPAKKLGRDWVTTRDAVLWYEVSHLRISERDFLRPPRRRRTLPRRLP
jgi:hypothetical protein